MGTGMRLSFWSPCSQLMDILRLRAVLSPLGVAGSSRQVPWLLLPLLPVFSESESRFPTNCLPQKELIWSCTDCLLVFMSADIDTDFFRPSFDFCGPKLTRGTVNVEPYLL